MQCYNTYQRIRETVLSKVHFIYPSITLIILREKNRYLCKKCKATKISIKKKLDENNFCEPKKC